MKRHTNTVQYHKQNKNELDKIMMTGGHSNFCPKPAKQFSVTFRPTSFIYHIQCRENMAMSAAILTKAVML